MRFRKRYYRTDFQDGPIEVTHGRSGVFIPRQLVEPTLLCAVMLAGGRLDAVRALWVGINRRVPYLILSESTFATLDDPVRRKLQTEPIDIVGFGRQYRYEVIEWDGYSSWAFEHQTFGYFYENPGDDHVLGGDSEGSRPVGPGAGGKVDPASTEATSWDTRSVDCPEAPVPGRRTGHVDDRSKHETGWS